MEDTQILLFEYKKMLKEAFRELMTDVIEETASHAACNNTQPNTKMLHLTIYCFLRTVVPSSVVEETLTALLSGNNDTDVRLLFDRMIDAVVTDEMHINPTIYRVLKDT